MFPTAHTCPRNYHRINRPFCKRRAAVQAQPSAPAVIKANAKHSILISIACLRNQRWGKAWQGRRGPEIPQQWLQRNIAPGLLLRDTSATRRGNSAEPPYPSPTPSHPTSMSRQPPRWRKAWTNNRKSHFPPLFTHLSSVLSISQLPADRDCSNQSDIRFY